MSTAKKILLYLAVFFVTLGLTYLTLYLAFGRNRPPKPVTLKVVGFWEPQVFSAVQKEFQAKYPHITLEYETRPKENYFANLEADLPNEQTTPDVFWWHSGWGPQLRENLDKLPDEIMSTTEYEKVYYPITKTDMKIAGSYRGLPLEIDGLALLYNKALLSAKNFNEPPSDWASLRQIYGPALTSRDKDRILSSSIALGSAKNVENFSEILGLFLLQNDVEFIKNNKLTLLESESSRGTNLASDAIDGYTAFSKQDKVWDHTQPNSIDAFAAGKTAMIILPAEKIHTLLETLTKQNLKLEFAVVPVPQLPDSETITWGSYWALGVSDASQKKEAAWQLAQYLASPEALRVVFKLESDNKIFGRAYPRVDMAKEQTTNPYLAAYLTQAPKAKSWYLHSDTADSGLNDAIVVEFEKEVAEIESGRSTSSSLDAIVENVEPILVKYGLITLESPK